MPPRAYRVDKLEQYQPRKSSGCAHCDKYTLIPSASPCNHDAAKKGYLGKYAGPIIFAALMAAAAMIGECSNRHTSAQKSSLESSVSAP